MLAMALEVLVLRGSSERSTFLVASSTSPDPQRDGKYTPQIESPSFFTVGRLGSCDEASCIFPPGYPYRLRLSVRHKNQPIHTSNSSSLALRHRPKPETAACVAYHTAEPRQLLTSSTSFRTSDKDPFSVPRRTDKSLVDLHDL